VIDPPAPLPADLVVKRDTVLALLGALDRCVVAYSGGVDSAVVAQAAQLALADRCLAVTGISPSLAAGELDAARELAGRIGIRHETIATGEFDDPAYLRNAPDRCYHCKSELYAHLDAIAARFPGCTVVNGANADDRGDYRPGMTAAVEHQVRSPLLECGITKADVRALAAHWGLPVWDKPASPCLSSRIAYGEAVTPERVAAIDRAERFLREHGFRVVRVRYHGGDIARIEAPPERLAELCTSPLREELLAELRAAGFRYATLDLAGFRSGSLNEVLPVESLRVLE
jgi:uncharacterized protein